MVEILRYLRQILSVFLLHGTLLHDAELGMQCYKTSAGVPQRSIQGPLLWNIMYNGNILGSADNIAVVIYDLYLNKGEMYKNEIISIIRNWLVGSGSELEGLE